MMNILLPEKSGGKNRVSHKFPPTLDIQALQDPTMSPDQQSAPRTFLHRLPGMKVNFVDRGVIKITGISPKSRDKSFTLYALLVS